MPNSTRKSEKTPIFRLLAGIGVPFMTAISKITITGRENVPVTGAFILTPNHFSNIDPLVVGVAMYKVGRMPRYLAKASLFTVPVLGALLRASGQVPVERSGTNRANPLKDAELIVDEGLAVVIYPEGSLTRDPDEWPMRGKSGAVRIALEQDIPLIPMGHWGAQRILPQSTDRISLFPRKPVSVRFGPEVDLSRYRGRSLDQVELNEATTLVMNAITAIVAELRGETAPAERWDPVEHNQTEIGRIEPA